MVPKVVIYDFKSLILVDDAIRVAGNISNEKKPPATGPKKKCLGKRFARFMNQTASLLSDSQNYVWILPRQPTKQLLCSALQLRRQANSSYFALPKKDATGRWERLRATMNHSDSA